MRCLEVGGRREEMILNSLFFSLDAVTFKAKALWEKNGAVIMSVRRPGCFLCREVSAFEDLFIGRDPGKWGPGHFQPGSALAQSVIYSRFFFFWSNSVYLHVRAHLIRGLASYLTPLVIPRPVSLVLCPVPAPVPVFLMLRAGLCLLK